MTEKRKAEDEADNEKSEKKQKVGVLQKTNISGIIDFTDINTRKKFNPDINLISNDGYILKYHIYVLANYKWFDGIINDCIKDSKEYEIKFEQHNGSTINLMLNWIEMGETKFQEKITTKGNSLNYETFPNLFSISRYVDLPDLENFCRKVMYEHPRMLSIEFIDCYKKFKLDMCKLYDKMLLGNYNHKDEYSNDFLSSCFEHGMKTNINGVVTYILPMYCPTEEQMLLFDSKELNSSAEIIKYVHDRIKTLHKGIGSEETVSTIFSKYKSPVNRPPGIDKYIFRIAELAFKK